MGLESTHWQERNAGIHGIVQFLPTLYQGIQPHRQTSIRSNHARCQMGMGRQRAKDLRRATTKAMFNPSINLPETGQTTPCPNRRIKICLFGHIVATEWGQKIETYSLSFEDNDASRRQLWRARQRTISNRSGTQGMETLPQRKLTIFQSPNRPQEPNKVHNDQGLNRPTNQMEWSLEWLRLQNRISTRKDRGQTRCLNQTKSGYAPGRGCKANTKTTDSLTKTKILLHLNPRNGNNEIRRNKRRRTPQWISSRWGNSNDKESFGQRRQRNEKSGPGTMPVERRIPLVPGKDLGSQQRRNNDEPYTTTPRYSSSGTWRNSKNNGAPTTQRLLAAYAGYNKTIHQEVRHVPKNESGTTCTLWPSEAKRSSKSAVEININGLHHGRTKISLK